MSPYALLKADEVKTQEAPGGTFVGIEYDIRKGSVGEPRSNRLAFSKVAVGLQAEPNENGRYGN